MTRRYGRARKGQRIRDRVPGGQWKILSILGAMVLYLPPPSPDLNPIEKAWSKLKPALRDAARAMPQVEHATAQALQTITQQNAKAWLKLRFGDYT